VANRKKMQIVVALAHTHSHTHSHPHSGIHKLHA